MKDKQGRTYARLSGLKVGDKVLVDDGFTCMKPWSRHRVQKGPSGDLFIPCRHGQHYLDGQLKGKDSLVGVYKV